ncbi:MAG: hypothetical protein IPG64_19420 [Haliea sp.]|nr:hypothetical protein [Haliea sp.]
MQGKEESLKPRNLVSLKRAIRLYLFRAGGMGTALKKDIWVNGKCIGETAPHMFFMKK